MKPKPLYDSSGFSNNHEISILQALDLHPTIGAKYPITRLAHFANPFFFGY